MSQQKIILVTDFDQLPADLLVQLYENDNQLLSQNLAAASKTPEIKPVIIQTDSPALREVIWYKTYPYEVGPLEYLAGRIFQLW